MMGNVNVEMPLHWIDPSGRGQENYEVWFAPSTMRKVIVAVQQVQALVELKEGQNFSGERSKKKSCWAEKNLLGKLLCGRFSRV